MQDRVSNHPNRWVLTPVAGESNTYDFTRADDPTVDGTPLNKATFLPDNVADAIRQLTGTTVTLPADALNALTSVLSDLDVGKVAHFEYGSYVGTGNRGSSYPNTLTFSHKPRMVWIVKSADWDVWHWANLDNNLAFWFYPITGQKAYTSEDDVVEYVYYSMPTDKSLSWYYYRSVGTQANAAERQMNTSGKTYYYVALTVD